jgi:hypothetical protein
VAEYIDFIGNSDLYQKSPAEWYLEPHTLLERSHSISAQHATLEAYRNSGNPVLALEVAIQKVFGAK